MLFALLYDHHDQVLAAAPACDQLAMGDQFWLDCHQVEISEAEIFATAYRDVRDPQFQARLLKLGIDQSILSSSMTRELEAMDMGGIQQRAA